MRRRRSASPAGTKRRSASGQPQSPGERVIGFALVDHPCHPLGRRIERHRQRFSFFLRVSVDEAGHQQRDDDSARREVDSQSFDQSAERRLGRAVGRGTRKSPVGGEAAHRDDVPAAPRQHAGKHGFDAVGRAADVERDHALHVIGAEARDTRLFAAAGAADQPFHRTERGLGPPHRRRHLRPVQDVARDGDGRASLGANLLGQAFEQIVPACRQRHRVAARRQPARQLSADAGRRSGHERNRHTLV
jgi:hypothetical protein